MKATHTSPKTKGIVIAFVSHSSVVFITKIVSFGKNIGIKVTNSISM